MKEIYYRSKIISLIDKIFIETGDARSRMQNCETKILNAYIASSSKGVPIEIQNRWEQIWSELNIEEEWKDNKGRLMQSSLFATTKKKRNKSMEKYLHFFLEEFYRVI